MGGRIAVENTPGGGATFRVCIPLGDEAPAGGDLAWLTRAQLPEAAATAAFLDVLPAADLVELVINGEPRRVRGLVCQVELEPWGGSIIPHERTMMGPVEDRLLLMRAVRANLSAVYAMFSQPCPQLGDLLEEIARDPPALRLTDEAGVEHRLWAIDGIDDVARWLSDRPLLIADGHHRYTMALRYQEETRELHGSGPWDRVMMLVVDAATERPPVLPIHRMLVSGPTPREGARVRDLEEVLAEVDDDKLVYGTAAREDGELVHRVAALEGEPPAVCALHRRVLQDEALQLLFTPDAVAAEEAVRTGEAAAAFFLPGTSAERIQAVIDSGERLPQKSTYFWPKPRTGMVIRPLEEATPPPASPAS